MEKTLNWELHEYTKRLDNEETRLAVEKEYQFYLGLKTEVERVPYEAEWVQKELGAETHPREKEIYFLRAKNIALEILGLAAHGALLAVDPEIKEHNEKLETGKFKEVLQGFVRECKGLHDAVFLKFPQVGKGIAHLEELIAEKTK